VSNQGFSELALQPLAPSDYSMVMAKSRENRLTFATWLMFFRDHGRFPRGPSDLESLDIAALARQIEVTVPADGGLLLAERTAKRLRTEIRVRYGFREATVADADSLTEWLRDHAAAEAGGEIAAMVGGVDSVHHAATSVVPVKSGSPSRARVSINVVRFTPKLRQTAAFDMPLFSAAMMADSFSPTMAAGRPPPDRAA